MLCMAVFCVFTDVGFVTPHLLRGRLFLYKKCPGAETEAEFVKRRFPVKPGMTVLFTF